MDVAAGEQSLMSPSPAADDMQDNEDVEVQLREMRPGLLEVLEETESSAGDTNTPAGGKGTKRFQGQRKKPD